jgi:hypothetical protein
MTEPSTDERALFSDLTRLFMAMRDAPFAQLEAQVEERVREFVRAHPEQRVGGLQITFSWALPDGADDWAVYGTEYRTLPASEPIPPRAVACGPAIVLAMPPLPQREPAPLPCGSAQIIPFPTC